ncbi:MAG: iron export ABC transporter permease subunit FetB [Acidimicrobiia bacterium]|nr:iron export ABC transporter permease subunit FetB [Acidimicrobiia bacterium]
MPAVTCARPPPTGPAPITTGITTSPAREADVDTTSIGWVGLAASLVLVAVALGLSTVFRLGLAREMLWAVARAAVQLLAVGLALGLVLDPDTPVAWAWAWVAAMCVLAAWTVQRRVPEVPGLLPLALAANVAVAVVSLGVIFGLGIFPVSARTVVPLGGMMLGNSMTATVVVARRVVAELRDRRDEVEARLALGCPWTEASRPYVRQAMRVATTTQVESTKAVGLIFLPGAMTGLVLAGVDATDAVQVQLAIMYLILGSVATSVAVMGLGLARRLFTPDHRLVPLRREA